MRNEANLGMRLDRAKTTGSHNVSFDERYKVHELLKAAREHSTWF